jgi:signal transduction histidine kinase/ligand-binding sensor domain-containing protein
MEGFPGREVNRARWCSVERKRRGRLGSVVSRWLAVLATGSALFILNSFPALALNPRRAMTQYTHTVWTQEHGLPQDTIRAITQTKDGYLWLGTDDGLARFDGYDFVVFNKENGALPDDSVAALWAAKDGTLWIGTPGGLTVCRDGKFTTYTTKDGLPDSFVSSIAEDRDGALWLAAGVYLTRFENGKFTNYLPGKDIPIEAMRAVYVSRNGSLYIAGFAGVARREGDKFVLVVGPSLSNTVTTLIEDRKGNLWVAGANGSGLVMRSPSGSLRTYTTRDGLPDSFVRSLCEDRDGNIWAGTNGGLARLEGDRFVSSPPVGARERDWVRSIYEDHEGNLWVGMNSGLSRFQDDLFTMYGEPEGLPSDEPMTVYQDHSGRTWVGFHDRGIMQFGSPKPLVYTTREGLPSNEIFSIREGVNGDLLLATRQGLSRMHDGHFQNLRIEDPLNRRSAFDSLEDRQGRLWVGTPSGLYEVEHGHAHNVIRAGRLLNQSIVVLCEARDGSLWAGSYGDGLWRRKDGESRRYTTADGLSSNQVRSLVEDTDGTLWIGTFGGGLNGLRDGRFFRITASDGLLSDNIAHIEDDGSGSLWLSTTRGICRLRKKEVNDFVAGRVKSISPVSYGVSDGLRSSQCAPGYPTSGGGTRTTDGRLWFPTSRGLAVLNPDQHSPVPSAPILHLLGVVADGHSILLQDGAVVPPGNRRIEFRYTGINLSAPESVRYSYRLEGLDQDWVSSVTRRITEYSSLSHAKYRFVVRAAVPGGPTSEMGFAFELQPYFYETVWFRYLCVALAAAAIFGLFRLRMHQIRTRFALVLDERARLAREIHDTLAQGFVGVSSQLDAVALMLDSRLEVARTHLQIARKMVRHSLTEARRSVMDLRASALEGHDLPAALSEAAQQWTAGSPVRVHVDVDGEPRGLPGDLEQQLLRIAQEAVTNSVKHAHAQEVHIRLVCEDRKVTLLVADDGQGFEGTDSLWESGGHFGLLGMRERAERLGGQLQLHSTPGHGTDIEVKVPLS